MAHSYIETTNVSNPTIVIGNALKYIAFDDLLAFGKSGENYTPLTIASRDESAKSVTISEDISSYDLIRISRNTSLAQLVDFQSGSRLSERDLDAAYQQGLFAAQEAAEDALATGQRTIIAEADIAPNAVTTDKVANAAVTSDKVADAAVTETKIEDGAVSSAKLAAGVALANIEDGSISTSKLASVLDEDDMASDSNTALPTQQSVKAYVDASKPIFTPSSYAGEESVTLPNGLILKFGSITSGIPSYGVQGSITFGTAFPTSCLYATIITDSYGAGSTANNAIEGISTTDVLYKHGTISPTVIYWQAIGY